jgi:hypothetical protein
MGGTRVIILLAAIFSVCSWAEDPWADAVLEYDNTGCNTGFCDPAKALGAPTGGGSGAGNASGVYSVGTAGSFVTLGFDTPIADDPENPMGLDFVVYGNSFYVGGNPQRRWMEPGVVEVSADVNDNGLADDPWYIIPGSRAIDQSAVGAGIPNPDPPLVGAFGTENPNASDTDLSNDGAEYDWGYADLMPVRAEYLDRALRPDDPMVVGLTEGSGGGDAFDIAGAVDGLGAPAGLSSIDFVRVWSLVQNGGVGAVTTEVDAVGDLSPLLDSDQDGILNAWETRVSGTDPLRSESTVLPLEIPADLGGSADAGTLLGTVADVSGNRLTLFSAGIRDGLRAMSVSVDLLPGATGAAPPAGQLLSDAVLEIESSVSDFEGAQVAWAAVTLAYESGEIDGLEESSLDVWRDEVGALTQDGLRNVSVDAMGNLVTFETRYPGVFVLTAPAGDGDLDPPPGAAVPPVAIYLDDPTPDTNRPVLMRTDVIRDAEGQAMWNGTPFTVVVFGATVVNADSDAGLPGHQVVTQDGRLQFALRVTEGAKGVPVTVEVYADAAQTELLGVADFDLMLTTAPLPLGGSVLLVVLLGAGVCRLRREERV